MFRPQRVSGRIPTEGIDQSLGFEDSQSRFEDFGKLAAALAGGVRVLQGPGDSEGSPRGSVGG